MGISFWRRIRIADEGERAAGGSWCGGEFHRGVYDAECGGGWRGWSDYGWLVVAGLLMQLLFLIL